MAIFSRRRREVGDRIAQAGVTPESALPESVVHSDDALQTIEDLFSPDVAVTPPRPPTPEAPPQIEVEATPPYRPLPEDSYPPTPERGPSLSRIGTEHEGESMAQLEQSVQELLTIDGAVGVAIADSASGMALAQGGHPAFDLGVAAAGNSNVVRAKLLTMKELGITTRIDDILITLEDQYHLINVLSGAGTEGLFVYLVLDRAKANLALARHKLASVAAQITI